MCHAILLNTLNWDKLGEFWNERREYILKLVVLVVLILFVSNNTSLHTNNYIARQLLIIKFSIGTC